MKAFAAGMLSALGHNPTFAVRDYWGDVRFNPNEPEDAALVIRIKAHSLVLMDNVSDSDRRTIEKTVNEEVLEADRYPEIVYDCPKASAKPTAAGQFEVTLNGHLTLHGVTRVQPVQARVQARVSATGSMVRAIGEFTLRQTDYGIKLVSVAGSMLKVKDELTCSFDMVANC